MINETQNILIQPLEAIFFVFCKTGKDRNTCSSYWPICLLNIDTKLYAKVLYHRLLPHISSLVHLDQVGFLPNREARDNTKTALNIIYLVQKTGKPCLLIPTDVKKDFDRVDWSFMRQTQEHIGLGPRIMYWILSIYSKPSARSCEN